MLYSQRLPKRRPGSCQPRARTVPPIGDRSQQAQCGRSVASRFRYGRRESVRRSEACGGQSTVTSDTRLLLCSRPVFPDSWVPRLATPESALRGKRTSREPTAFRMWSTSLMLGVTACPKYVYRFRTRWRSVEPDKTAPLSQCNFAFYSRANRESASPK